MEKAGGDAAAACAAGWAPICRRHSETGAIAAARSTSNRRKEGLDGWMGNVSYNYTHIHHPYIYICTSQQPAKLSHCCQCQQITKRPLCVYMSTSLMCLCIDFHVYNVTCIQQRKLDITSADSVKNIRRAREEDGNVGLYGIKGHCCWIVSIAFAVVPFR
jgi:hypothetical protein